jgi:hypothetical protein
MSPQQRLLRQREERSGRDCKKRTMCPGKPAIEREQAAKTSYFPLCSFDQNEAGDVGEIMARSRFQGQNFLVQTQGGVFLGRIGAEMQTMKLCNQLHFVFRQALAFPQIVCPG